MTMKSLIKFAIALPLTMAVVACGDSSKKDDDQKAAEVSEKSPTAEMKKPMTEEDYKMAQKKYLEDYALGDGVVKTESGLLYKVLSEGDASGASPAATDTVKAHYEGTLIDGTKFDSSYDRGEALEFPLNRVIPGWTEALQLMKPGDVFEVVIPSELGYGERGAGGAIPPHSTLKFKIELVDFQSAEDIAKKEAEAALAFQKEQQVFLDENAKKDGVMVTDTGLHYKMDVRNDDGHKVADGDVVTGHFSMKLLNGTVLSDTRQGGKPVDYPVDEVFPGWSEGAKLLKTGEKASLAIPASLAFGPQGYARGGIPGGAVILMELEIESRKTKAEVDAEEKAARAKQADFITDYQAKHSDAVKTESGLVYRVITAAEGNKPTENSTVKVHYAGRLIDGSEFDSSYKRGQPSEFGVTQVIKGWTEGLQLMSVGSKFEFVIPSDLGYGDHGSGSGSIPPGATLVFEVELLEIK